MVLTHLCIYLLLQPGVQGGQQAENKPQPSSLKDAVKANGNDSDIFDALFSKWGEDLDLAEVCKRAACMLPLG